MTSKLNFLATILISLQLHSVVNAVGSASTVAVAYGTSTVVCGITAGELSQRIQCFQGDQIVSILPNVSFEAISGGRSFFCGLRTGGFSLHCWKTDIGFSNFSFQPKRLYNSPTVALTDLAVGDAQVCAREVTSGRARCWRGVDMRVRSLFPSPEAALSFHTITSGNKFSCGILKKNRTVWCWGSHGIGSEIQSQFRNLSMASLVAGESHVCGLTLSGVLVCKGNNDAGQLDVPSSSAHEFSGLALGATFTCAIRQKNGLVSCWGGQNRLKFSNNTVFNDSSELITAGLDVLCGLKTSNMTIICWFFKANSLINLPLGMIIPGPCVQDSCSLCGIYPNSALLCDGSGNICKSCQKELPIAVTLPQSPPPPLTPASSPSQARNRVTVASLIIGSIGAFAGSCTILYCLTSGLVSRSSCDASNSLDLKTNHVADVDTSVKSFSLSELASATNDFSPHNKIGAGSFGVVYKGELSDGREVAIKRGNTNARTENFKEKDHSFGSELTLLSRLHHKHLVGIVGFCQENNERLLVYEYMSNGSLHDHLHNKNRGEKRDGSLNTWQMRIKIALDAARGIEYLHNYAVPPIIHRDIKSANILVDVNWTARVSDFGFSLMGHPASTIEQTSTKNAVGGTIGYIDPEYYVSKNLTAKSDVYGLGIILLELLTGKKAVFKDGGDTGLVTVAEFAVPRIGGGELRNILDNRIRPPEMNEVDAVELLAYTAMHCVNWEGEERPDITEVVGNLERALALCNGESCYSDL